jgi:hypothetical protein
MLVDYPPERKAELLNVADLESVRGLDRQAEHGAEQPRTPPKELHPRLCRLTHGLLCRFAISSCFLEW